jgi:nucleoside phosphorylase
MARQLRREDYTVGWVCALPVELAAAQEMLDEEHPDLERDPADNDENLYALGSISGHSVAIVCLPAGRIGNNPAAAVSTQMRATFKAIRFGLMVGIGGGVPSAEADVRLGDVVASESHGTFAGVVQYDMGKTTLHGFERTGSLNSPPQILLAAVMRVKANELRGRSKLSEHIAKLKGITKFQRSKAGPDVLFEATYDHEAGQTCDGCNPNRQDTRQARDSAEEVVVHYGTIASSNQVMRSAAERDRVSAALGGVLCFEMEAAGLMNSFPCLVIRGICDYADSHKNKRWQPYAASTAAAYAKEVLSVIPPAEVAKAHELDKTIRQATTKRHLDGDSAYRSNKRAKLSHRRDELDGLECNEEGKTSSENSEGASSEDGESGSSEHGESESESESSEDGEQDDSESESDDQWH